MRTLPHADWIKPRQGFLSLQENSLVEFMTVSALGQEVDLSSVRNDPSVTYSSRKELRTPCMKCLKKIAKKSLRIRAPLGGQT